MPRWNCVQIEDSGTLTPTGYLFINQIIALVQYQEPAGLMGQILTPPGEIFSRWLTQDIAPPENHGNQLLFSTYRTDKEVTKKADMFGYSPTLRRVRRLPQPRRQEKFPNQPVAYDDFFSPDFMRRGWFPVPLKTQAGVSEPEEFFLRPHLYRDKFPTERTIRLSPDLEARIQAQEKAGHIVFTGGQVEEE